MNKAERVKIIRAMELIARSVNDKDVFDMWLTDGVADGDIDESTTDDELDYYTDDDTFSDLMDTFLVTMKYAHKSGGLYVDGVVSEGR